MENRRPYPRSAKVLLYTSVICIFLFYLLLNVFIRDIERYTIYKLWSLSGSSSPETMVQLDELLNYRKNVLLPIAMIVDKITFLIPVLIYYVTMRIDQKYQSERENLCKECPHSGIENKNE